MFVLDVTYGGDTQQAERFSRLVKKRGSVSIRRRDAVRVVHTNEVILAELMRSAVTEVGSLPVGFTLNLYQRWDEDNLPDVGDTYAANNFMGSRGGEAGQVV